MTTSTNNLGVPLVDENQAQKATTINQALAGFDNTVGGLKTITTTGGTIALTDGTTVTATALYAVFVINGTLTSNAILQFPATSTARKFTVINMTTGAFMLGVKIAAQPGTVITVTQGKSRELLYDGTNIVEAITESSIVGGAAGVASFNGRTGGISLTGADVTTALTYTPEQALTFAGAGVSRSGNTVTVVAGGIPTFVTAVDDGVHINLDFDSVAVKNFTKTITADRALAFQNILSGAKGTLVLTQDGAGGHALTMPSNVIILDGGAITTSANRSSLLHFDFDGTTIWVKIEIGAATTAAPYRFVICDGDSLTRGGADSTAYPYVLNVTLDTNGSTVNLGRDGCTLGYHAGVGMIYDAAARVDPLYDVTKARNIVVLWGGTNDFALGYETVASNLIALITQYCNERHALGWDVVVSTMLPRLGLLYGTTASAFESMRSTFNSLLRSSWATFADGLADPAADARFSDCTNLTYFDADQCHLNTTGKAAIAGIMEVATRNMPANSAPSSYVLDTLAATPYTAYSTRRLRSAYMGNAIRIRRSSDNTEMNIGFVSSNLDTEAIATFVGANSAYITKFYDQSGNARDAVQATNSLQPRIVNAGTLDVVNSRPAPVWDGVDDYLSYAGAISGFPYVYSTVFLHPSTQGSNAVLHSVESGFGASAFIDASAQTVHCYNGAYGAQSGALSASQHSLYDYTDSSTTNGISVDGGTIITGNAGGSTNSGNTLIGASNAGIFNFGGNICEHISFHALLVTSDQTKLHTSHHTYWGTP